jgi:N-acetylneuraminic acid mutarotase
LTQGRSEPTATVLLDGRVLVVGGSSTGSEAPHNLTTAELYDPVAGRWTATGSMLQPRLGMTATRLADGRVLVAGGYDDLLGVHSFKSAEIYDPQLGTWSATGSLHVPRGGAAATLLRDGRVLVTGGVSDGIDGPVHASAELFDPRLGTWTYTPSMAQPRFRHVAVLLSDGTVLVAGGKDVQTDDALFSTELYVPS